MFYTLSQGYLLRDSGSDTGRIQEELFSAVFLGFVKLELLCYSTFCVENTKCQRCICEDVTEFLKRRYISVFSQALRTSLITLTSMEK